MHSNSATSAPRVIGRPFAKGVSGNPGGRPVGSRTKLTADFMRELADHFATKGRDAINRLCDEDPATYVRVVAALMPKDVHIAAEPLAQWTDEELVDAIAAIERWIAAGSPPIGMGAMIEGEATTEVTLLPGGVDAAQLVT